MLARIHRSMEEKDRGFTLIELLVVMIIIGILAAIAIPVFLNQRKKAVDSSIKSDIRSVATAMETYYTDNQAYAAATQSGQAVTIGSSSDQVRLSTGNTIAVNLMTSATASTTTAADATGFCIRGKNAKGSDSATGFLYNSLTGGFTTTATGCPS